MPVQALSGRVQTADKHCMGPSSTREAIGFLCRWCLLASAGGFVALAAGAGASATAGVHEDVRAALVPHDWLAAPASATGKVRAVGFALVPPLAPAWVDAALVHVEGMPLTTARTYRDGCIVRPPRPREGTTPVRLRGLPYGVLAFRRGEFRIVGVPKAQRVFLVDARLAREAAGQADGDTPACLRQMRAAGAVALFHTGPPEAFVACRRRLDAAGVREPLVFLGPPRRAKHVVAQAAFYLRRGPRGRGVEVVTGDPALARHLAAEGYSVHFVGPAAPPVGPGATLRRHASLAALKESFPP